MIYEKQYVQFLVGRDGDFGQTAASTVRRGKRAARDDSSVFVRITPYPKAAYEDNTESLNSYYDEVEVCQELCLAHFKAAITIRNNNMIDSSDLVVAYVERKAVVHIKHWNTQEKGNNQYC